MSLSRYCHAFWKYISNPDYRFLINAEFGAYKSMPDREYLERKFQACMGTTLNTNAPQTFNEKLQWLKLYDRNSEHTKMVDKYLVRDFVKERIGEEYLIPLIGVWDNPCEIDFETLPNQFVLKCNHNSGLGMFICKDKSKLTLRNIKEIRKNLSRGLEQDYYLPGREWPYKNVQRKIICEKYMEDSSTSELRDYKFFCFNGVVKCYKVDFDRFVSHRANYFTPDGKLMKIGEVVCPPDFDKAITAPANLEKMKELAMRLSESQPFLRTDFYEVDGKIYFGELTFYPASGFGKFVYDSNDDLLGSWIKLPENIEGSD